MAGLHLQEIETKTLEDLEVFASHFKFEAPIQDSELFARNIAPPIVVDEAVVPVVSKTNDKAAVKYRITSIKNKVPKKSKSMHRLRQSFIDCVVSLIQDATGGVPLQPWEDSEVYAQMPKKIRADMIEKREELHHYWMMELVRTFLKKESYPWINAPRIISNPDHAHFLECSRFAFPFVAALKKAMNPHHAYQPGRRPHEVRESLATIWQANKLFGADYSKFDGTQDPFLRNVCFEIMVQVFASEHTSRIRNFARAELQGKSTTKYHITFQIEGRMVSGSAFTTVGNTLLNMFVYYAAYSLAFAKALSNGSVTGSSLFDRMLGEIMCYGDDSLGPIWLKKSFFRATAELGLTATEEQSEHGISFLGRIYPYQHMGTMSMSDPLRLLPKLHITCAPKSYPLEIVAANRAIGLKSCYGTEPVIASWADAVLRAHYPDQPPSTARINFEYATRDEIRKYEEVGEYREQWGDEELDTYYRVFSEITASSITVPELVECLDDDVFPCGWSMLNSVRTNTKFIETVYVSSPCSPDGDTPCVSKPYRGPPPNT